MSALACLHRKAYPNEARAMSVIFALRARGQDCERLEAYECAMCGKWHLRTTKPQPLPEDGAAA